MIVRELSGFAGGACLVRAENGDHFVVSSANVPYSGPETLVFAADSNGKVTSWRDIAGGKNMSREEAIEDLAFVIRGEEVTQ